MERLTSICAPGSFMAGEVLSIALFWFLGLAAHRAPGGTQIPFGNDNKKGMATKKE